MRRYKRTKLDANHAEVIAHIEAHGGRVVPILDPVDIYAHYEGFGGFLEIKIKTDTLYTRKQLTWIGLSGPVPVAIVKDGEQAMNFLKTGKGITEDQKTRLVLFLGADPRKFWHPKTIEAVLNA